MIIGDPQRFAIESSVMTFYERLSFRASGRFLIHVAGRCYGVNELDATMLACSFDEVQERLARRGSHLATFAAHMPAGDIADAFNLVMYAPDQEEKQFFGMSHPQFHTHIYAHDLIWAPDGDEAFDDGSFVLHFDEGDRVRLVAYKTKADYHHDPQTLSEVWLEADEFYRILKDWQAAFEAEWRAAQKS